MKKVKEEFQRSSQKDERGITLVALVITIVILIILAVVTINFAFGDNGLIKQAEKARDYQANADATDSKLLNDATEYIDGIIGGNGSGGDTPTEPTTPSTVEEAKNSGETFEETTEIKDDSGDSIWIPGGFGVAEDSATDADDGIVITDGTNEFVWIPVSDYTTMYEDTQGEVTLNGVTTTTSVYSKLRIRSGDSSTYTAGTPGTTTLGVVREPDVVTGSSGTSYDASLDYYSILGYSSTQEMADGMVEEYTATYNSIKKYKGFYIGRYELTGTVDSPTVQKGQTVLTDQNWYNLKKACSNIVSSEYAQSEMIYGNQWDEVMSWLISTGEKTEAEVNEDSISWGNYNTESGGTGAKQISGYSENWKANNIYDLAGNCDERTQEANSTNFRIIRGR